MQKIIECIKSSILSGYDEFCNCCRSNNVNVLSKSDYIDALSYSQSGDIPPFMKGSNPKITDYMVDIKSESVRKIEETFNKPCGVCGGGKVR